MIYMIDAGHPDYARFRGGELSPTKLLKLACLYEMFRVPDAAVELILRHRDAIATLLDPAPLVELLTPPLHGDRLSYAEYVRAFEEDPQRFFPRRTAVQEVAHAVRDTAMGRIGRRLRRAVASRAA